MPEGLLDFIKTPEGIGLLSTAFGGFAGARRGQPLNSLGRAGLAGITGYNTALDLRSNLANNEMHRALYGAQIGNYNSEVEQRKAALEKERQKQEFLTSMGDTKDLNKMVTSGLFTAPELKDWNSMFNPEYSTTPQYDQSGNAFVVGKDGAIKYLSGVKQQDKTAYHVVGGNLIKTTEGAGAGAVPVYNAPSAPTRYGTSVQHDQAGRAYVVGDDGKPQYLEGITSPVKDDEYSTTPQYDQSGNAFVVSKSGKIKYLDGVAQQPLPNSILQPGASIYNPNTKQIDYTLPKEQDINKPLITDSYGNIVPNIPYQEYEKSKVQPISVSPGTTLVNPQNNQPVFTAPDRPTNVAPGGTLYNTSKNEVIFTAPEKKEPSPAAIQEYIFAREQGEKRSFTDWDTARRKATASNVSVNTGQKGLENEMKFSSAFKAEPIYKAHQDVQSAYKQIAAGLNLKSPAGDLAAATKLMKMLDPGSVVRESELAMAMQASGKLDRLMNYGNMVVTGQKLTPTQRLDFQKLADELNNESAKQYNAKREEYKTFADSYKLNSDVLLGKPVQVNQPAQPSTGQTPNAKPLPKPMKGMTRNGYKFKGGDPADQNNWEKQ